MAFPSEKFLAHEYKNAISLPTILGPAIQPACAVIAIKCFTSMCKLGKMTISQADRGLANGRGRKKLFFGFADILRFLSKLYVC